MSTFLPGFTIMDIGYDQPSSGGQSTGGSSADPSYSYYNHTNGYTYFYDAGEQGDGWYYLNEATGELVYVGASMDVSDTSIWERIG